MSGTNTSGADIRQGIPVSAFDGGHIVHGRMGDDDVMVARVGDEFFAVGAFCTHYHGALADGLVVDDTVRCPLHHACFSLRTGDALRAPALDPIATWNVERRGDRVFVKDKRAATATPHRPAVDRGRAPASVVIIGGGGAGQAAAEMLRREGYAGPITMLSADTDPPCDRPNLSKEFLSGEAQEDWIPLRGADFFSEERIDLVLHARVTAIDPVARRVTTTDGVTRPFGALLIATGAEPVRLPTPATDGAAVHYLRTLADSKALIARATKGTRAVVIGASFIGLEVAASLRIRGVAVDVVSPDAMPLGKIMGPDIGRFIQHLHEAKGVTFHLGETVASIHGPTVTLSGGGTLDADFVVAGVGVRPAIDVAEKAGLVIDTGISVNEYLETSAPGIFAAGDVARWHDRRTGQHVRVEHWVVAERQGQVAARNILGAREVFDAVPFFWSQHYDTTIRYTGHAEGWDVAKVEGDPSVSCRVSYRKDGRELAVATIGRDLECLHAEVAFEREPPRP